jgi:hypothetical protein
MHFCKQFSANGNKLVDQVCDIFFECLLAADRAGNPRVRLFDSPPLAMASPDLVERTAPFAKAVREDSMEPHTALRLIGREAEKYRIH